MQQTQDGYEDEDGESCSYRRTMQKQREVPKNSDKEAKSLLK